MPNKCYCGNEILEQYSDNYYRCGKCHTLISKMDFNTDMYDVKDEDNDLYGRNYWQKTMLELTGQTSLDGIIDYYLNDRVIYWLKYILKYIPLDGKVAEVGCGLGQLAYAMKTIGYNQVAFELSPDICKYVRETLDINICCGEFSNLKEKYDAVLAFDLFEHLTQPKEFLMEVFDCLSENGIICIQMPCYDNSLSYKEMLEQKPRFQELLTELQHVYLYSKEAIADLLKEIGFCDIIFEPACFGDDYDMFLFAAKKKLNSISDIEIEEKLNRINAGRMIKALFHLYQTNKELQQKCEGIEKDSAIRLANIEQLEKRLESSQKDRNERLTQIVTLEKLLEESEQDRSERLRNMEALQKQLEESEQDRVRGLRNIETLQKQLEESEQDRAERLRNMETLQKQLEESEQDRAERLQNMETLQKQLEESEQDRAERLRNVEILQKELEMLKENNIVKDKMLDVYLSKIEEMQKARRFFGK